MIAARRPLPRTAFQVFPPSLVRNIVPKAPTAPAALFGCEMQPGQRHGLPGSLLEPRLASIGRIPDCAAWVSRQPNLVAAESDRVEVESFAGFLGQWRGRVLPDQSFVLGSSHQPAVTDEPTAVSFSNCHIVPTPDAKPFESRNDQFAFDRQSHAFADPTRTPASGLKKSDPSQPGAAFPGSACHDCPPSSVA